MAFVPPIPDCAFQLGVPRTQRQYLGNWLTESTADVYTRQKRNVVVQIWKQVATRTLDGNDGKISHTLTGRTQSWM